MNGFYLLGNQKRLEGSIAWLTQNFKMALLSAAYTPNLTTHEFVDDLTGIVATSPNLGSKTSTLGVANCGDFTFTEVTGDTCIQMVLYRDTGVAATSPLLMYIDTAAGLPCYPNGEDIPVVIDPAGLFSI